AIFSTSRSPSSLCSRILITNPPKTLPLNSCLYWIFNGTRVTSDTKLKHRDKVFLAIGYPSLSLLAFTESWLVSFGHKRDVVKEGQNITGWFYHTPPVLPGVDTFTSHVLVYSPSSSKSQVSIKPIMDLNLNAGGTQYALHYVLECDGSNEKPKSMLPSEEYK